MGFCGGADRDMVKKVVVLPATQRETVLFRAAGPEASGRWEKRCRIPEQKPPSRLRNGEVKTALLIRFGQLSVGPRVWVLGWCRWRS
jgi:hypothetical protein